MATKKGSQGPSSKKGSKKAASSGTAKHKPSAKKAPGDKTILTVAFPYKPSKKKKK